MIYSTLIGKYDAKPNGRLCIQDYPDELEGLSDRRKSRYYKINSHLLSAHDISVYLDACLNLKRALPIPEADIAVFHHPKRDCLYREAELCKKEGLGNVRQIQEQIKRYFDDGFPTGYGLGENCCIIRKNTRKIREFNELWWQEYLKGSERDQLSFMYCVWKTGVSMEFLEGHPRENKYYNGWGQHRKSRESQEI